MNILSGLNITNFASQSSLRCNFVFDRDFSSYKDFKFGISGDTADILTINNRIVYDRLDRSIYSIPYQEDLSISIASYSGITVIYANNKPVSTYSSSGLYRYLILSGTSDTTVGVEVYGEPMNISFDKMNEFCTGSPLITGVIYNNSSPRSFKINTVNITNTSENISVASFETGDILSSGIILLSGIDIENLPSGNITLEFDTNYKPLEFIINSSPPEEVIEESYISLVPDSFTLNFQDEKDLFVESYFNFGSGRNLSVSLSNISLGVFTPKLTNFDYVGTGSLSGFISGYGDISGIISGIFSGTETGYSDYSTNYTFTGLQQASGEVYVSGLSNSGISSGNIVYTTVNNIVSGVLSSGDSGNFTGIYTGIATGDYYEFSGFKSQHYTFGSRGTRSSDLSEGYSGSGINTSFGLRSRITGFNFVMSISGAVTGYDEGESYFQISDWKYKSNLTGEFTTGLNFNQYYTITPGNFSGLSGSDIVYTGFIPNSFDDLSHDHDINDLIGENVSGLVEFFIGDLSWQYAPFFWGVRSFYIRNFPVDFHEATVLQSTGLYSHAVTGDVSEVITGIMTTGVMFSSGSPSFIDVWNLKSGKSSTNYLDFKYYNKYSTGEYENSGSYFNFKKNTLNRLYLNISHNGNNISGNNVSNLNINDGIYNLNYLITGYGEQ